MFFTKPALTHGLGIDASHLISVTPSFIHLTNALDRQFQYRALTIYLNPDLVETFLELLQHIAI
jgi:hypothetical protein